MDSSILNGLLTTVFTSACFFAYKMIKRYTLKSSCVNNELHISVKDLNEKVDATHEFIKMVTLELIDGVNQYKKQQEGTITTSPVETEDMKDSH
jgi:hypothetical protein